MTRNDSLKIIIRLGLLAMLALVIFVLKSRIVTGKNCSVCPGNGTCNGETDCSKY